MVNLYLGRIPVFVNFFELDGRIICEISEEWTEGELSPADWQKVKARQDFQEVA